MIGQTLFFIMQTKDYVMNLLNINLGQIFFNGLRHCLKTHLKT
jgi:hypothetical protein